MNNSLPFSVEAEKALLSSIMLGGKAEFYASADLVTPASFYVHEHQLIYEAISFLAKEDKPIDIVTISTYLRDRDIYEAAGGNSLLLSIADFVFSSSSTVTYAKTVRNKFNLRQLIKAGNEIVRTAENEENLDDVFSKVEDISKRVLSLHSTSISASLDDDVMRYQLYLDERQSHGASLGWSWGPSLQWLDENTDGIQRKKTYRIGAKSNVGKTQFVYSVILSLLKQGAKVAFFTLENEKETTINFLLANLMGVNSRKLARGEVKPDVDLLFPFRNQLTIIDNQDNLADVLKTAAKLKPDVVLLDYIGLITIKGETEEGKYASYARAIPQFAKDNNVSWIDLSNLPISVDDEQIKQSGQFFGASQLRNNLDVGIHLCYHKPFYEWKDRLGSIDDPSIHNKQVVDVRITKNRLGPTQIEKPFMVEFDKGGRVRQLSNEEAMVFEKA